MQFYTGKPYVTNDGGYVYKYRTYNPEMSRWTSVDPSGFPDGPNSQIYAPVPTAALDNNGLFTINFVSGAAASPASQTITIGTKTFTVSALTISTTTTAASGEADISVYKTTTDNTSVGGVQIIVTTFGDTNSSYSQNIATNHPLQTLTGTGSPDSNGVYHFADNNQDPCNPNPNGNMSSTNGVFSDGPQQSLFDANVTATFTLTIKNGAGQIGGTITYGYTISE
jgi:RHS repeat-associated protein